MNDQEQIKALAELDGLHQIVNTYESPYGDGPFQMTEWTRDYTKNIPCPPYLTSRDAIIPVIEKQPSNIQNLIANFLTNQKCWTYLCTPKQLAEALLRSTGKWKD